MDEVADDPVSVAAGALGEPDETFRINRARIRTKFWTALGLIFGSVVVVTVMLLLNLGIDVAVFAKILLMPMIIGSTMLVTLYRQRGLMVLVYPAGLLRLQRGNAVSFPWDEITEVRLKVQRVDAAEIRFDDDGEPAQCWLPSEAPSMMVWQAGLWLERADEAAAHVSPAIADYDRLVKIVQRRTFPRLWADARDRLLAGETIAFGDLEVTPAGLRHTSKKLPWKEFKELIVAQGKLTVKKTNGWMPWAVLDVSKVPNPHVLFALVQVAKDASRAPAAPEPRSEV
jgi:hypothetical protein